MHRANRSQPKVVGVQVEANAILMRFSPFVTVSTNLTMSGSSGTFSIVHSQNEAISAARSTESFESARPDSMMGIRAAEALRRLISGVDVGICFDIVAL